MPERGQGRIVWALVLASFSVRAYLACRYYGFQSGDDLELLEQALHRSIGLAHSPWNIRSLFIPDMVIAPAIRAAFLLGVRDPLALSFVSRIPIAVCSAAGIALVYRLGRHWYEPATALIAASLYACHWTPLVYGSTLFPRPLSVLCILAAAVLLEESAAPQYAACAGLIASMAATARYSELIFLGSFLILMSRRPSAPRRVAAFSLAYLAGICLFAGLYDKLTWNHWFGSLINFSILTFVKNDSSGLISYQPPWWYLTHLGHWIALSAAPLIIVAARRGELLRFLAFIAFPLAVLSSIFHKEFRYIQVLIPFVCLLAAQGFMLWYREPRRRTISIVLLALSFPLGLARIGQASRRTTNAVAAARWLAEQRFTTVALSQPWAYGGNLFLGNVRMIDLDVPPRIIDARGLHDSHSAIAVFTSDIDPDIKEWKEVLSSRAKKEFNEDGGGRSVTVLYR